MATKHEQKRPGRGGFGTRPYGSPCGSIRSYGSTYASTRSWYALRGKKMNNMKKQLILFLLVPLFLQAQDHNTPYVKFDREAILFYIPSQTAFAPLLPVYKPGFVHILKTPGFRHESTQELSGHLGSRIQYLASEPMTSEQKTEFLENYACLVLLNYTNVSEIDTLFYIKAVSLKQDPNEAIKENASLVVKMVDLYWKE